MNALNVRLVFAFDSFRKKSIFVLKKLIDDTIAVIRGIWENSRKE